MKKTHKRATRLLQFLGCWMTLLISQISYAQSGATCTTPVSLSINSCINNHATSDTVVWFSFNSGSSVNACKFEVTSPMGSATAMSTIQLYSGSCGTLSLVQTGFQDLNMLVCEASVSPSTNYWIRVARTSTTAIQFNICLAVFSTTGLCPTCTVGNCQLVCNPGMELNMGPPQFPSTMWACNWVRPSVTANSGTPDFFNDTTGTSWSVSVPNNFPGTQTARSGGNYLGFYCFYDNPNTTVGDVNYREFVQTKLRTPLTPNVQYRVSYYVSLADRSSYAVAGIGAYFSATNPVQTMAQDPLSQFTPQVVSTSIITNTTGWVLITDTITVTASNIEWLTIGNFQTDASQTRTTVTSSGSEPTYHPEYGSYYYLEDVTVEPLNSTIITAMPDTVCSGNTLELTAYSPHSNGYYTWTSTSGATWSCVNSPFCSAIVDAPPLVAVTYTVTTTFASYGGCTDTARKTPTILAGPNSSSAGTDQTICLSGTDTLIGTGTGTYNTTSWSVLGGGLICTSCATIYVTHTATTQYVFTVSNSVTGCSKKDTVKTTVVPLAVSIVAPAG
ncbi:MAG TPA: hypothetical protein VK826_16505, partial [Bacteroidia bacterium]|nr:hypothetical protein [Bacteroidia bacterium]